MGDGTALTDPVTQAMAGRADLTDDFEETYGRGGWHGDPKVRVRVFRAGQQTLIAFTALGHGRNDFARYIDLMVPRMVQKLGLDPSCCVFLEHSLDSGSLALFEGEWTSEGSLVRPIWKTFNRGGFHHYAGKDYVQDLLAVLDQAQLPQRSPHAALSDRDAPTDVIDVEVVHARLPS